MVSVSIKYYGTNISGYKMKENILTHHRDMGTIVHLCLSCIYANNYSYQENLLPKYHAKFGYKVSVIASCYSFNKDGKLCVLDDPRTVKENGYNVIRLQHRKGYINKILRRYIGLYSCLERLMPDIIFIHGPAFADVDQVIKYKRQHRNVKIYFDSHTDYINSGHNILSRNILHPIIWRYYVQKLLPYTEKCYGVTPLRCQFLEKVYKVPSDKISLLRMGVDDDAIPINRSDIRIRKRKELGFNHDDLVLVSGGKIDELKNIHILLSALNKLESVKLILFGTILPEFKEQIEPLLHNPNVRYVGWASAEEVIDYMLTADVACFPGTHSTLWEEAVGLGLPCILKHWVGMTHTDICHNVIWIKGDDIDELVSSISCFCNGEYLIRQKKLSEKASQEFLYSEIAAKAIDI